MRSRRMCWRGLPRSPTILPMVEYIDSAGGLPGDAVGNWLSAHLVAGLRSFRCQSGFFSLGSLRDHLELLRDVEVVRLVLGSNAPEQPTAEDIRALLPLLTDSASRSITVVRCSGAALFHPKTIHIIGPDGTAIGYVGSANMTEAGLGLNVEAGVILGPESAVALDMMAASIDSWSKRSDDGVIQVHGDSEVDCLLRLGLLVTDAERRAMRVATRVTREGRRPVPGLRRVRLWRPTTRGSVPAVGKDVAEAALENAAATSTGAVAVDLRWCKRLKRTDAQQVPKGTNPTGNLRLARARFPIDHRTFFRDAFFADATWAPVERGGSLYEECIVPFHVRVHGADIGKHNLRIDHALHRVADQNNVPTVLGWGPELGRHLRANSEVDNWVVLERIQNSTYTLTITNERPEWAP